MSNPGHTQPGALRPGLTTLPDGRLQLVTFVKLPNGWKLDSSLIVAWGDLYSDIEKVTCTGVLSHLAGLRLTGGQEARQMPGGGEWVWMREYEDIHATDETRVGRDIISKDEDGRRTLAREWVQFSSNAFVEADSSEAVTVAGVKYTLATERAADAGNIRRISRTYVQSTALAGTAEAIGPVVIDYPFDELGDATHVIAAQTYQQAADAYAPLALNSTRVVKVGGSNQTLYCIGDGRPQRYGVADVRFTRRWANVPATRTEPETHAFSYPGYRYGAVSVLNPAHSSGDLAGREGFVEVVNSRITLEFFLVGAGQAYATGEDIPLISPQTWIQYGGIFGDGNEAVPGNAVKKNALSIYLYDFMRQYFYSGYTIGLLTAPTRTAYEALVAAGGFPLVAECRVDHYEGNIHVRRTRRVPAL